ncbi:unnamed protein product [Periconia digitata]|uniref:Uncharacterized protein n=1 Tax=Periconia digitata TaxID=1303443 RepID=A0A9W4XN36_9PLEO|nr:unnamed protein product [Periconia digitata]
MTPADDIGHNNDEKFSHSPQQQQQQRRQQNNKTTWQTRTSLWLPCVLACLLGQPPWPPGPTQYASHLWHHELITAPGCQVTTIYSHLPIPMCPSRRWRDMPCFSFALQPTTFSSPPSQVTASYSELQQVSNVAPETNAVGAEVAAQNGFSRSRSNPTALQPAPREPCLHSPAPAPVAVCILPLAATYSVCTYVCMHLSKH